MAETSIEVKKTDKMSFEDRFCWDQIMGVAVPFIISEGVRFAELTMLKKTIFKKHIQVLSNSVFKIAWPTIESKLLYRITAEEKKVLDKINIDSDNFFSSTPYCVNSTFLLGKYDVYQLYELLETIYKMVVNKDVYNSKCGFTQIDNSPTPVPFVDVENVGMVVPLFFFESTKVSKIAFLLEDYWLITYLKLCCKLLTILPSFYDQKAFWVVKLDVLHSTELNVFRSLPPNASTVLFLRQEAMAESNLNKTKCPDDERIENVLEGALKPTRKRHLEENKLNDDFILAEKMPKLNNTTSIKYEKDCDELVEETITIKIESSEPETTEVKECREPEQKILETYITTIKENPQSSQICASEPVRRGRPPKRKFGDTSKVSINTNKPPLIAIRSSDTIGNRNNISPKAGTRIEQQNMFTDSESLSTLPKPQSQAPTFLPSSYVPAMSTLNESNESISRPVGHSTDLLMQHPLGLPINLPIVQVPTPQSGPLVNLSGAMIQNPEQQTGTMVISSGNNIPGIYTMAQQPNTMAISTENILQLKGSFLPLDFYPHAAQTITGNSSNSIITPNMPSSIMHHSGISSKMATTINRSQQEPQTSLAICSSSTYVTTSNMSGSLSQSSISTHSSDLSANTQNVIPEPLLSGTLMQLGTQQAGPIAHQTGTILVTSGPMVSTSMAQMSNIMAAPTENIAQQNKVSSQESYLQEGLYTSLSNTDSNPVKLLHIPNSIAQSLISQNSSTNSSALKSQERQSRPQNKLANLKRFEESSSDTKFINILPKPNKSEIVSSSLSINTSLSSTVKCSEVLSSPVINSLPLTGTVNNASTFNNALIFQPNNAVHNGIMNHAYPSSILNSSIINFSPQNGIMTPSGIMTYQNGFLGNLGSATQAQNSLQLLNSSGFVINSNNILGLPNCLLTPQPNMSSIQNLVIAASNDFVLCPSIISSPLNEQVKQTHITSQPGNVTLLNNNYAVGQNNNMMPNVAGVEQINGTTFATGLNNVNNVSPNSLSAQTYSQIKSNPLKANKRIKITRRNKVAMQSDNCGNISVIPKRNKTADSKSNNDVTVLKKVINHSGVVVTHLNDLKSYKSKSIGGRCIQEDSGGHNDDIKIEINDFHNSFSVDTKSVFKEYKQNDNIVGQPDLNTKKPNYDVVIKTESNDLDVKPKDCSSDIIDLTDNDDGLVSLQEYKKDTCTIISDERMEKLVMWQGMGREVLYKVNEIPDFDFVKVRTYKVVNLIIQKFHSFYCISMDPMHHDDLLISVMEIVEQLFPHFTPKTFMAIVNEIKLEVFSLNATQKTVLQRFYVINERPDVSEYLYFRYKKFIVRYEAIKRVSERFLKILPAGKMEKIRTP